MRLTSSIALSLIVALLGSVIVAADDSSSDRGCLSQTRSSFLTPILSFFFYCIVFPLPIASAQCTRVQTTTAQPNRQVLSTPAPSSQSHSSSSSSMQVVVATLTNSSSPTTSTSTTDGTPSSSASASSAAIRNEPLLHGILVFLSWVWIL